MSYEYAVERARLFTEDGQVIFIKVRDRAQSLLREAGAFRMGIVLDGLSGDAWQLLACVDRLVELGEIHECTHPNLQAGQNRIFTDGGWRP